MSPEGPTIQGARVPASSTKPPTDSTTIFEIAPSRPSTENAVELSVKDYQNFITLVLTISIFGASTFAVIAGQMEDPAELWKPDPPPFRLPTVRRFLAAAWLCFILAIAVSGYSSSLLTIFRQQAKGEYHASWGRSWEKVGLAASVMLHLLLVFAFMFLALGLVAYVGTIGWVAVGFACIAGVFVLGLSAYQLV